jgi:hypothetical protein
MTSETKPAIPLRAVPDAVVVTAVLVATVWVVVGTRIITPYNQMEGLGRVTALPIQSLPARPVMHLTFARSQADVSAVLDVGNDREQLKIKAVDTGNWLDSVALVPGYTLLLIALTLLIARGSRYIGPGLFQAGVVFAISIALADLAENYGIMRVLSATGDAEPVSAWVLRLMVASAALKWMLLGLVGIGLGVVASLQEQTWRRRLSLLLLATGLLTLAPIWRHAVDRFFG